MGKIITTYTTYEISADCPAAAAGVFVAQIAPPQGVPDATKPMQMGLLSLTIALTTAVQSYLGLVRASTYGTPTVPGTFNGQIASQGGGGYFAGTQLQALGPGQLINAWSVAPTAAAIYYRQDILPATIGAGLQWTWPEDDPFTTTTGPSGALSCPASSAGAKHGVLIQNLGGGACGDLLVTARWMEFRL